MSRKAYLPAFGVLLMLLSLWSSPLWGSIPREASTKNAANEAPRHFVESRRSLNFVYDPQVEHRTAGSGSGGSAVGGPAGREERERPSQFLELGINNNGGRAWRVYGPDRSGSYGGAQGIGGIEAFVDETGGSVTGQVNNSFGDTVGFMWWYNGQVGALASSGYGLTLGGYGPQPGTGLYSSINGYPMPEWRGRYPDTTGLIYSGARYYEARSGRFLSPEPLGHASSLSLYDYASGDPINFLDPDGRCIEKAGVALTAVANAVTQETESWVSAADPAMQAAQRLISEIGPKALDAGETVLSAPFVGVALFFGMTNTANAPEPDMSSIPQRGWILNPGEHRGQDGTIYTSDGQVAVYANGTSNLSNQDRQAIAQTTDQMRNTPGTVTVSTQLPYVSGNWLNAATPSPIPAQIATALGGQQFNTFGDMRSAIWQTIAADPTLNQNFTFANLANMRAGNAPYAPGAFQINDSNAGTRFNLHHIQPLKSGGAVYDLGNLWIVSPLVHSNLRN